MSSGVKILGHSVHPILIVFPLGLLATAVIFDVFSFITDDARFLLVSYYVIAAGLIGGLVAAIFGLLDWISIENNTRAKSVGLIHGLANVLALSCFFGSWLMRSATQTELSNLAFVLAIVGAVFALVGGWLGGELVERLGISVHRGANPNAPSSLSVEMPE